MTRNDRTLFLMWLAIGLFWFVGPATAYVDPGSGSVIITTILGVFAAIGFTLRKYFYRIRRFFRKDGDVETSETAETDK